jgi:hypothetical protein
VTDYSVEDILSARRSLRERANAAAQRKADEDRAELEYTYEALRRDTRTFLSEAFDMSEAEIHDVVFHNITQNKKPVLYFKVEGIEFNAMYDRKKMMTVKSSQFEDEDLYESELRVEVRSGSSIKRVRSLEDLGAIPSV